MSEQKLDTPYIGLVPFDEENAPFFFGRGPERNIITANLTASRLTVLYGVSGVGKSSVLQAGVLPFLHQLAQQDLDEYGTPEFVVVLFRSWLDDPVVTLAERIHKSIAKALRMPSLEQVPLSRDLTHIIEAWTERFGVKMLIILDQFEDYFAHHSEEVGEGTFAFEFPKIVNRRDLRAHFLISIRADSLSRLDQFKEHIPNLFDNRLEINRLNRESARAAIEGPIEEYNKLCLSDTDKFRVAPTLIEEVLNQVEADRDPADEPGKRTTKPANGSIGIEAPYLQLVMRALWEHKETQSTRILRPETLREELKGVGNIVLAHLKNVMDTLSPEEQEITYKMFERLVTPSGIRSPQLASDLARLAKAEQTQVEYLLKKLADESRLLRPVEPPRNRPRELCYEVSLDVVARAILSRLRDRETEQELAEAQRKQAEAERRAAEGQRQLEQAQALAEAQRQRAEEQQKHLESEARLARIRLRFATVLGLMALGLAVLATITFFKWREARAQHQRAEKALIQTFKDDLLSTNVFSPSQNLDPTAVLGDLDRELKLAELDKDPNDQASILHRLGGICAALAEKYEEQKDDTKARQYYQRAEEYYLRVEGLLPEIPDKYSVANTLNDLAVLYLRQKKFDEAQPRFERALSIATKAIGENHRYLALYLSNIAQSYTDQGRCSDAEPYCARAQAIMEKALDSGQPSIYLTSYVASSLNELATCYAEQKRYEEAEQRYKEALELQEKTLGADHTDVADTLDRYAELLRKTGREAEAKEKKERAKHIQDRHKKENPNN